MPLTMLVVFIISPTERPFKFGEHMEKMCNKSQNKECFTMNKEFAHLPPFLKNNTSAPKRNVRISSALVSQNVGLGMKPNEN
jgi:hypothetical protein